VARQFAPGLVAQNKTSKKGQGSETPRSALISLLDALFGSGERYLRSPRQDLPEFLISAA
jgi:hypothetical protein